MKTRRQEFHLKMRLQDSRSRKREQKPSVEENGLIVKTQESEVKIHEPKVAKRNPKWTTHLLTEEDHKMKVIKWHPKAGNHETKSRRFAQNMRRHGEKRNHTESKYLTASCTAASRDRPYDSKNRSRGDNEKYGAWRSRT